MDRTEATGFGIAFAGHAALLAALSLGLATVHMPVRNDPIEVSLVDEVALQSASPTPTLEAPAPMLGEVEGPPEPVAAPSLPEPTPTPQVEPQPQPRVEPRAAPPAPAPRPTPQPVRRPPQPQPQPKAAPPKAAPKPAPPRSNPKPAPGGQAQSKASNNPRSTGRLDGLLSGIGATPSQSKSTTPPASTIGSAQRSALRAEVQRQLKPHWKAPTGADAEQLRTVVTVTLSRSGAVVDIGDIETTGITASNRAQVKLHQEQAVRAIRLAAPFRLPAEYYEAWKVIQPTFDRRL
ncbi:cell envelope biogenesis protein TolA [Sphingomonas parva]|uniref:Cell envelope biogenesis protein TolA n=1 Tax=Sphingomonas parva TaxID=2555898 RepID=A0A4Y8ZX59_9SPHN|nr:TonB C-terminal domain-containing protein [Sphingomonas parva]TFI59982.1 cell envelope biogenesis protein TolA [Sphingomonas parva]